MTNSRYGKPDPRNKHLVAALRYFDVLINDIFYFGEAQERKNHFTQKHPTNMTKLNLKFVNCRRIKNFNQHSFYSNLYTNNKVRSLASKYNVNFMNAHCPLLTNV